MPGAGPEHERPIPKMRCLAAAPHAQMREKNIVEAWLSYLLKGPSGYRVNVVPGEVLVDLQLSKYWSNVCHPSSYGASLTGVASKPASHAEIGLFLMVSGGGGADGRIKL